MGGFGRPAAMGDSVGDVALDLLRGLGGGLGTSNKPPGKPDGRVSPSLLSVSRGGVLGVDIFLVNRSASDCLDAKMD